MHRPDRPFIKTTAQKRMLFTPVSNTSIALPQTPKLGAVNVKELAVKLITKSHDNY